MIRLRFAVGFLMFALMAGAVASAKETHATVVYDEVSTDINSANEDSGQLWITTTDLKQATRFEVKPQGVCRDVLCFPLPKSRHSEFLRKESGKSWFNLVFRSAF
jgi:hypothetical protein